MADCVALAQLCRRNSHWLKPRGCLIRVGKLHLWLGIDSEADEVIVATPDGVHKVRTVKRNSPSQQWRAELTGTIRALPCMPKVSAEGSGKHGICFPELIDNHGKDSSSCWIDRS